MLKELNKIFEPHHKVGFKDELYDAQPYELRNEEVSPPSFYCINPLLSYDNLKYENLAEYRNMLVEFDGARLSTQERWVREAGLPYSLKTFSGSKSFHYIVSLSEGVTREEYAKLAAIILKYIFRNKADDSCANPNRLSRTPNAMRGDVKQELLEQSSSIRPQQLRDWINNAHKSAVMSYEVNKEIESERRHRVQIRVNEGVRDHEELLQIFAPEWQQMLRNDRVAAGRRHSVGLGIAIKLYQCGMNPDDLAQHISEFLERNGKGVGSWQEASQIVAWVARRVTPFEFDELSITT
jgi:hypothetical protein